MFCFFFWLHHLACRILVPRAGTEPGPAAVEAWSPNHWTEGSPSEMSFLTVALLEPGRS